jgi:hypothetical protein
MGPQSGRPIRADGMSRRAGCCDSDRRVPRVCMDGSARWNVVRAFERIGMEVFVESADGMFVWARFPHVEDSLALAKASQRDGIMQAPGAVFRPHLGRSPWMRFNVTTREDTRAQQWLQHQAEGKTA